MASPAGSRAYRRPGAGSGSKGRKWSPTFDEVGERHQARARTRRRASLSEPRAIFVERFGGITLLLFQTGSLTLGKALSESWLLPVFFKKNVNPRDHSEGADSLRSAPVARDSGAWAPPDGPPLARPSRLGPTHLPRGPRPARRAEAGGGAAGVALRCFRRSRLSPPSLPLPN